MTLEARFVDRIERLGRAEWNALRPDRNPFLAFEFLDGLERHGCLQPRYGWRPHHLGLYDGAQLVAAAPLYLKANSHGEFVFDQGWAEAYHRHGLEYYPKLLCAVPYSPVTGPRLLTGPGRDEPLQQALLTAICSETEQRHWSSAHINFAREPIEDRHWLHRQDWQFHWRCDPDWRDWEDFLAALQRKKRKNILQERQQVRRQGLQLRRVAGSAIRRSDLQAMYGFYLDTFQRKGNLPALSEAFFLALHADLGEQMMLAFADRDGQPVAGAMFLFDDTHLYGRYWGALADFPGLHFELCYYSGIEFCFERGLRVFEPGAQGEHKIARGFLPEATHSWHRILDPRFEAAIAASLQEESRWLQSYRQSLMLHSPYRPPSAP